MIHFIRHSGFLQLFWGTMAAFLLNLSVDAPDPGPRHLPEDLAHNEQESITEWVVEYLLGFEDAFSEYDDDDSDERNSKVNSSLVATLIQAPNFQLNRPVLLEMRRPYPQISQLWSSRSQDIVAPPPRA